MISQEKKIIIGGVLITVLASAGLSKGQSSDIVLDEYYKRSNEVVEAEEIAKVAQVDSEIELPNKELEETEADNTTIESENVTETQNKPQVSTQKPANTQKPKPDIEQEDTELPTQPDQDLEEVLPEEPNQPEEDKEEIKPEIPEEKPDIDEVNPDPEVKPEEENKPSEPEIPQTPEDVPPTLDSYNPTEDDNTQNAETTL